MNYSCEELNWIKLSVCSSYESLRIIRTLIKIFGVDKTVEFIQELSDSALENQSFLNKYTQIYDMLKQTKVNVAEKLLYCAQVYKNTDIDQILDKCHYYGISVVTPVSKYWPQHINFMDCDTPLAFWCRGKNLDLLKNENSVSVVGARNCSSYAGNVAVEIGYELSNKSITVISGGAYGVDAYAHIGALNSKGNTISILAGGVDKLYPQSNVSLFSKILETGLIISENSFGTRPAKWKFLHRNRLIAGLSKATVIVEAGEKSGALNTANYALEYGKTLAAVPGQITDSSCKGTNNLIKNGAYCISSINDIFELISYDYLQMELPSFLENDRCIKQERIISSLYKNKARTFDELFSECELSRNELIKSLTTLEIKGKIRQCDNGWIIV